MVFHGFWLVSMVFHGFWLSPRLEDKLTLATEEGTKLVSALYSSWRSTKTDIRMSMVK